MSTRVAFSMLPQALLLFSLIVDSAAGQGLPLTSQAAGPTLVINEFMAQNSGIFPDPAGDSDDWIELYNYGGTAVDAGGCYLTDDPANPTKWQVPTTNPVLTTVPAHGFLLIWADEEGKEGPLHAGFKLSAGGESIALYDSQKVLLDELTFGPQGENASYGRLPDGSDQWRTLTAPTPGRANTEGASDIVISEIMYHPFHSTPGAEDLRLEWIELFNRGAQTVSLTGWRFSDGVDFMFPAVSVGAGKYLAVAADVSAFKAGYPGVTNVVGGWAGRLSNSGERITLVNAAGAVVDTVRYADEGDWAVRELGPVDNGHRGWQWFDAHDGGGMSLELIGAGLPNEFGQNWAASLVEGGTPGRAPFVPTTDIAPMIVDVAHQPIIPRPSDVVIVTARVIDERTAGVAVTLRYRLDSSTYTNQNVYPQFRASDYRSVPMLDDGQHGDGPAGDGVFGGLIPAQTDGRIVEFYVEARDVAGRTRTWPAPSLIDGEPQQVTNALYQVDGAFDPDWTPGDWPIYYVIMTEMERGRLETIGRTSTLSGPNSQMNATFISVDGTGMELRYNVGIRNRGHGTRRGPPNNQHLAFSSDRTWNGRSAISLNCRNTPGQIMGSAIFRMAGLPAPYATPVQLRINGANLATSGGPMYGVYARIDAFDSDFAKENFGNDPDGNLYSCFRDAGEADFRYLGANPDSYRRSYFKESNGADDDWSDLIHLVDVLNNAPEATYVQDVSRVVNLSQWLRYIALDSLLMNYETGLNRGIGDDYFMYCGVTDPRFVLIPHDLDSILDQGGAGPNLSIFTISRGVAGSNGVDGLRRFFEHPDIVALYHQAFLDLLDDFYNPQTLDPLFDQVLGGFAPASRINAMKQIMRQRIDAVRAQIPQGLTITSALPVVNGYPRTTTRAYTVSGVANAAKTRSVLVNGTPGVWSPHEGTWRSGGTDGPAETLVAAGSEWKYLDDGSNQGTAWRLPAYNDSAWRSGPAELGYGDNDEATVVNGGPTGNRYITTYFRTSFTAENVAFYATLRVRLVRDDGAVIYLNGNEACRSGLPAGPINHLTPAGANVAGDEERTFFQYDIPPGLLREGTNVIAVEIHQAAPSSADISFNLALEASRRGTPVETLLPGINRVVVQAFDGRAGGGAKLEEGYLDIWYDDGGNSSISGTLSSDRTLDVAAGPWHVTSTLTVPAARTLTIEPGTTLFFNPGAGLVVRGRLLAEGTPYQTIHFTSVPGSANWAGLQFLSTTQESRLVHVNMEYGDAGSCAVRADHANVYMDHVVWAHHTRPYLIFDDSAVVLRNSVLPSIQGADLVRFIGMPANGRALFEGNRFGATTSYHDIINLTGGQRPGPIARFLDNTFAGAGDDCIELNGADAHCEGNVFLHVHADVSNGDQSHAITTGAAGSQYSELTVVRNLFYDVDHALLCKDGAFITAVNNTVVHATQAVVNMYEAQAGQRQGKGLYSDGNIFRDVAHVFANPDWAGHPAAITLNNSMFPTVAGDPLVWAGQGNIEDADPHLLRTEGITDPRREMRLLPSSPAIEAGPNGRDMGGAVPAGAAISGEPFPVTWRTSATLAVGGPEIHAYKYRVNNGSWSAEVARPGADLAGDPKPLPPIQLNNLQNRQSYTVYVIGKDSAGVWQSADSPTASRTWTIDTSYRHLVVNEVLADNVSAVAHGGAFLDMVELYYDGPAAMNLSGMSLTDDPQEPGKFVFPAGVTIRPGEHLVLYGGSGAGSGFRLGFAFKAGGDGVYLYDKAGTLVDSIEFGMQLADLSIGRVGPAGVWRLTVPTFGQPNVAYPLGDPRLLRINEWLASAGPLSSDEFIELYNPHPLPVDLGGFYLTDTLETEPDRHRLSPLTFIAGEGYAVFDADGGTGSDHVGFRLSADGEIVTLFDAAFHEIDKALFGAQTTDVSQGRSPDGAARIEYFSPPTPGAPNAASPQGAATTVLLVAEAAAKRVIVPTSISQVPATWKSASGFDDSAWLAASGTPGGVGFERGSGYEHLISLDVGAQMYGRSTTCYIRIPFSIASDPASSLSGLDLSVRYDDGLVAYLNGVEVGRINFTGTPAWNSAANANHEADAQGFDAVFDLSDYINVLRQGSNLLAIQGLNVSTTSSDFLISAVLEGTIRN